MRRVSRETNKSSTIVGERYGETLSVLHKNKTQRLTDHKIQPSIPLKGGGGCLLMLQKLGLDIVLWITWRDEDLPLSFMFVTLPSRIETFRNLILDWSLITLKFVKRKEGKKFHISTFAVSYSCKHKTENSWKELCAEILAENCSQGTLCDAIFVKSISKDNGQNITGY